jgi:transaldolase
VKDPAYADTRYVMDLVAPDVVSTMPEATLNAVADHGEFPTVSIRDTYDEAHNLLEELAGLGIDYANVVQLLEDEGVQKFDASWDELAGKLAASLTTLAAPGRETTDDSREDA